MIEKTSYTKAWIESFRGKSGFIKSDPALIEKMIFALALLEKLASHTLDFVFKGGTSLILLFENANRFSIDIDISTKHAREHLEAVFTEITRENLFSTFELDAKRSYSGNFPKAHYKFYYKSNYSMSRTNIAANYVLLDIVFEQDVYPEIRQVDIKTKWLLTKEPYLKVAIPTVNSILGDKLTAYAPGTTGVPFNCGKETEIIKQLFDIAFLVGEMSDLKEVSASFFNTAQKEIEYRRLDIEPDLILDDIFQTGMMIARRERNSGEAMNNFEEIIKGIRGLKNMLISDFFAIEQAIEASAKAAWFAMKIKNGHFSRLLFYHTEIDMSALSIENPAYQFLNKLKKTNRPAFYYWYQCLNETGNLK